MGSVKIAVALVDEAPILAQLHREEIASGFLSTLGLPFLTLLYQSLIESDRSLCLTAKDNQAISGFICGSREAGQVFRRFAQGRRWQIAWALRGLLLRPRILKGILETARYGKRGDINSQIPDAELFSLVVQGQARRTGIGSALVAALAERLAASDINQLKVVVGEELEGAASFYQNLGFKAVGVIEVHAGRRSQIMVASTASFLSKSRNNS